jgi:hypothetical protein
MAKAFSGSTLRVMRLLEFLAESSPGGRRFNDICNTLSINRTTCSQILQTMSFLGYAIQIPGTKKWTIGPKMAINAANDDAYYKPHLTIDLPTLKGTSQPAVSGSNNNIED